MMMRLSVDFFSEPMMMFYVRKKSLILCVTMLSTVLCGIVAYIYVFTIYIGTNNNNVLRLQFQRKIKMVSGKPLTYNLRCVYFPKCSLFRYI